jgi:ankyrin repeat protein
LENRENVVWFLLKKECDMLTKKKEDFLCGTIENLSVLKFLINRAGLLDNPNVGEVMKFLYYACVNGNLEMAKLFLAQGIDPTIVTGQGEDAFLLACGSNTEQTLDLVKLLIQKGCDIQKVDYQGENGLYKACESENITVVKFLTEIGCDMTQTDDNGDTCFHQACIVGNRTIVEYLFQQGFDLNLRGMYGCTGYHFACIFGNLEIVKFFLKNGYNIYDVVDQDQGGDGGLHLTARRRHLDIMRFLLSNGFEDINQYNAGNCTALTVLTEYLSRTDVLAPDDIACFLVLIEEGGKAQNYEVHERLIALVEKRICEITIMRTQLYEKFPWHVAQTISDFTMEPFTNKSLQNLKNFISTHG